jgi:hypothetical protein
MEVLALALRTARRIGEVGFVVGAVGGLLLALGAAAGRGSRGGRASLVVAGLCIAVGFVLGIVYLHWG